MGTWMNADGLYVKFGTDEATPTKAGEVPTAGMERVVEFVLDLTTLTTSGEKILADNVVLPKNARIEAVEVVTETAAAGSSSTLDIGVIDTDRSSNGGADSLAIDIALTAMSEAGEKTVLTAADSAAGALVGTKLTKSVLVTAGAATAVFTDGVVKIRVKYYF